MQCLSGWSLAGVGCYRQEWANRYLMCLSMFCTGRMDCRHLSSSELEQQKMCCRKTLMFCNCCRGTQSTKVKRTTFKSLDHIRKLVVILKNSWPTNQVLYRAGIQVNAASELQLAPLCLAQDMGSGLCACTPAPNHSIMPQERLCSLRTVTKPGVQQQIKPS